MTRTSVNQTLLSTNEAHASEKVNLAPSNANGPKKMNKLEKKINSKEIRLMTVNHHKKSIKEEKINQFTFSKRLTTSNHSTNCENQKKTL